MSRRIRAALISVLSSSPVLLGWVRLIYCTLGLGTRIESDFLFDLARRQNNVFVLQVGANDGVGGDPIHQFVKSYKWKGLLLEPLPDIFEKLQGNYRNQKGIILHNAALAARDGAMTFYRIKPGPDVPEWCDGLGSFSRETILSHKHKFPTIENHVVAQTVEALSFKTLVEKFGICAIDVIVIDTEGYDYEVLKQIDFQRFRPELVIYEQIHLSDEVKKASIEMLNNAGYDVHNSYNLNFVAVRRRGVAVV